MRSPSVDSAPAEPAPLLLRTLGTAGLYADAGAEQLLGPGKPLALFAYLALTPGRRISREFLMELLWADVEPDRARNALRQALFHLRRLLGESAVPGTEELTLACTVDTDRDLFLDSVERGDLDGAVERYTGSFLPDFAAPGGAAFEQWCDLERTRLQTAFLSSAELVVRRRLNESRVKDALRIARRARDLVPAAESAWRLVLESVIAARDFVAAAVEAEALESFADQEGTSLEPATRAAIARARQVTAGPADTEGSSVLVADLTGREREFSIITGAWDAARTGHARHLHLTAPAGLGKTRLLRDAAARLRAGGARVVEVRGAPGDRDIPYAFAGDLAMAIAALPGAAGIAPASASALIALNPALSSRLSGAPDTAVGDEALRRRIQALGDLVGAVAYERPFALAVDDVHWIDAQSYRVLEGLFARLAGAPVLCLTAARPERVPAGDAMTVLPLSPLTPAQVGSLVFALGAIPDGAAWGSAFVAGLHASTRGSPLLILESLRLALDERILTLDVTGWSCESPERLESLLQAAGALRRRVRALPEDQARVLTLLGVAGTPMSLESLVATARRSTAGVTATLAALERHGLAARSADGWIPAHDEIAQAAQDALAPAEHAEANRALAAHLVSVATDDATRMLRGIRHFVAAADDASVRAHFRRFTLLARDRNDRRPLRELAAGALGDPPQSSRAKALARSVPLAWRAGLWNWQRQTAAAVAAVVLVAGTVAAGRAYAGHSAALQRIVYADSGNVASVAPVVDAEWDGRGSPVIPARGSSQNIEAALSFKERVPSISPDGRSVAWIKDSGDSTTLDIWIRTPAGTRRLTNFIRDDLVTGWTPDGSAIVGMTNRWSPPDAGNYDIAVFDTATGAARQITSGPSHDGGAIVSPDGTRIAFVREPPGGAAQLCVVPFDALSEPECRLPAGSPLVEIAGWSELNELIIAVDSARTRSLIRYDWGRAASTVVFGPRIFATRLSPNRRWVIGAAPTTETGGFRDWIIPIDRPANARIVNHPSSGASSVRWWEGLPDKSLLIDRIVFVDSAHTIQPGIGTRLRVRALSQSGAEIPLRAPVRWTSGDTSIATVDSLGDVRAKRNGDVSIEASLSGWRRATTRLTVRAAKVETVLDEKWDDSWRSRWITFGDPQPQLATGPGGIRGMWNNGDGTFQSFALYRGSFTAREGLGVEVRISTPIARDEWQRMRTIFAPGVDTALLQRGDQRKAPASVGRMDQVCAAGFPAFHGALGRAQLAANISVGEVVSLDADAAKLVSGAWWTLRLQLFPDGRCGIAINNRVVWISPDAVPLDAPFWLRLGDESKDTRILHGPLQVWTGVRTDVDWSSVPPRAPKR